MLKGNVGSEGKIFGPEGANRKSQIANRGENKEKHSRSSRLELVAEDICSRQREERARESDSRKRSVAEDYLEVGDAAMQKNCLASLGRADHCAVALEYNMGT